MGRVPVLKQQLCSIWEGAVFYLLENPDSSLRQAIWRGDTKKWRIPFELQNPANSEDENWGPLSDTIVSGKPNLANIWHSCWIVVRVVAVVMGAISIHFECAWMRTRNMVPATGPAKSMWSWDHWREGHTHGCSSADGSNVWHCWQLKHCFTVLSMSRSIPGHHINPQATAFILVQPRWPQCNSVRRASRAWGGTTTRTPHTIHPLRVDNSRRRVQCSFNSGLSWLSFLDIAIDFCHKWFTPA